MLFASNEFLFVFLPITLAAFHLSRALGLHRVALAALLLASLYFYQYWSVAYCALFVASIVANFLIARAILVTASRLVTALGIIGNLLLLGYFKYTNFLIDTANQLTGAGYAPLDFILPIGISFYTFIQIAFLADVYAGKVREPSFVRYGLFVSFFPHMLAGPIVHHAEMMPQFGRVIAGSRLQRMLALGVALLVMGLAKKVLIADQVAQLVPMAFGQAAEGQSPDFFNAWVSVLAYTFQIYFDFSGYSDMAIGLALMFGIRFPANFNSPYKARSIIDFWRRWHMTLSRLLRDYVYIPLGGSRRGAERRYVNLFATMLIGGIWHGAGWNFVFWGALHGFYLVVNHGWRATWGKAVRLGFAAPALTFLAVVIAWVPFRAADFDATLALYRAMAGFNGLSMPLELGQLAARLGVDLGGSVDLVAANQRAAFYTQCAYLVAAALIAFLAPNSLQIFARYQPVLESAALSRDGAGAVRSRLLRWRPGLVSGAIAGIALFLSIRAINSVAPTEFLYFQF